MDILFKIYGMSNEQPTKALLSVMFKSIASKYENIVALVPLPKMDSSFLRKLFNDVMNAITTIGYDVMVSFVEVRSSNVKFYKKELCTDKLASFVPLTLDQHQFLYLLYNSTHIFKCIYNNFQKHILSECPKLEELTISPNFHHIIDWCNMELSKPVKIASVLSDECLNPQT